MAKDYVGIRVEVNSQFTDKEWVGLKLVEANSSHTVGYLVQRHFLGANSVSSGRSFYPKRSRISAEFGEFPTRGLSTTFRGHITHHVVGDSKKEGTSRYVDVRYFVIGTSRPFQEKHTGSYHSWSSAAKAIAKRHKFKAVVHTTPMLTKPIRQTESDFKFLVRGAAATGFRFNIQGTTVYFVDPKLLLKSKPSTTPYFEDAAIHSIQVEEGEDDGASIWEVHGTTPDGKPVTARSTYTPADPQEDTSDPEVQQLDVVVESLFEAQQAVDAKARNNSLWVSATVETDGDARVFPGRAVYLAGNKIPSDHTGVWLVEKVTHEIDIRDSQDTKNYSLTMKVSKDRLSPVVAAPDGSDVFVATDEYTFEEAPLEEYWGATEDAANDINTDDDAVEIDGLWQAEFFGLDEVYVDA